MSSPGREPRDVRSEPIVALADTGATLAVLPGDILDRLGIPRLRRVALVHADGRRAERDVGDARIAVNGTRSRVGWCSESPEILSCWVSPSSSSSVSPSIPF